MSSLADQNFNKNILTVYSVFFLRGLLGFIFTGILVRSLGLTNYGSYLQLMLLSIYSGPMALIDCGSLSYAQNLLARVDLNSLNSTANSNFATSEIVNRQYDSAGSVPSRGLQFIAFSFFFQILIQIFILISLFIIWKFQISNVRVETETIYKILFILIANVFTIATNCLSTILISQNQIYKIRFIDLKIFLIFCLLCLLFWNLWSSSVTIFIAFLLSQVIAFLFIKTIFKTSFSNRLSIYDFKFNLSNIFQEFSSYKTFFISQINSITQRQGDFLILSLMGTSHMIGVYDSASKIPAFCKTLNGKFSEVLNNHFTRWNNNNNNNLLGSVEFLKKLLIATGSINLLIGIHYLFFSEYYLETWLGSASIDVIKSARIAGFLILQQSFFSLIGTFLLQSDGSRNLLIKWPSIISWSYFFAGFPVTYFWGIEGTLWLTTLQFFTLTTFYFYQLHNLGLQIKSIFLPLLKIGMISLFLNFVVFEFFKKQKPLDLFSYQGAVLIISILIIQLCLLFLNRSNTRFLFQLIKNTQTKSKNF